MSNKKEQYGRLALGRRKGESVTVDLPDGRTIKVTVYEIDRGCAKLLFEAPRDVTILRDELRRTEHGLS